jgi:hypothetical protein
MALGDFLDSLVDVHCGFLLTLPAITYLEQRRPIPAGFAFFLLVWQRTSYHCQWLHFPVVAVGFGRGQRVAVGSSAVKSSETNRSRANACA